MTDNPHTHGPLLSVGPNDQEPAIVVTGYVLLVITILTTIIRLVEVLARKRGVNGADALCILATLIAFPQTILVNFAATHGLGRHIGSISANSLSSYYQDLYAAQLLAIPAMACAKLSVIELVRLLDPHQSRKARLAIAVCVGIWTVLALFALAFQCGLPNPWVYQPARCNSGGLEYAITALNLLTDAYIAAFFVPTVWKLQMDVSSRMTVVGLFASRLVTCAAEIAELAVLPMTTSSSDQTWTRTAPVIIAQTVLNFSIITANLPALKRFLYELQTGANGAQLGKRQADIELSSKSREWSKGGSKSGTMKGTAGSGLQKLSTLHKSQVKDNDAGSNSSEDGILRVVDVRVDSEQKSEFD